MKEAARALISRGKLSRFPCLCGAIWLCILCLSCPGIGTGHAEPVFSVSSVNEPLYQVLAKVSKSTGYKIEITKGWENKSITADLKRTTLDEGLKAIIRSMGSPNHAIVRSDRPRKVEIKIFDTYSGHSSTTGMPPASAGRARGAPEKPSAEMVPDRRSPDDDAQRQAADMEMERHLMDMEAQRQTMERDTQRQIMEMEAKRQREQRPGAEVLPPN
ncbi:MAG: hypothetical protein K4571_17815 [Deltaproteobacteria bacterium]